jgi:hypothetical protein
MKFNPEDGNDVNGTGNFGPHCRNCHSGASSCERCHSESWYGGKRYTTNTADAAHNYEEDYPEFVQYLKDTLGWSVDVTRASQFPSGWVEYGGLTPAVATGTAASYLEAYGFDGGEYLLTTFKREAADRWFNSRTVAWSTDWRTTETAINPVCSDDGFSWPHRTMGYMMLKDALWGLDFDGSPVAVGEVRDALPNYIASDGSVAAGFRDTSAAATPTAVYGVAAHDLDSVCLDCHNPNIWNASSYSNHYDSWTKDNDNFDDELLLRGLP